MVQRVRPTVIIQRYARRLLAILLRNWLRRVRNIQGGPDSLREQRRQIRRHQQERRQQSVDFWTQRANRVEATGLTDAAMRRYHEMATPFPGNGALRWHTQMRNRGDARPSNPSYSLVHRVNASDRHLPPSQQAPFFLMVRSDAVDAYTQDDLGPGHARLP